MNEQEKFEPGYQSKKRLKQFIIKITAQLELVVSSVEALNDCPNNENLDDTMLEVGQLQSIVYMAQKNARIKAMERTQ